jgi:hypothetical protein
VANSGRREAARDMESDNLREPGAAPPIVSTRPLHATRPRTSWR